LWRFILKARGRVKSSDHFSCIQRFGSLGRNPLLKRTRSGAMIDQLRNRCDRMVSSSSSWTTTLRCSLWVDSERVDSLSCTCALWCKHGIHRSQKRRWRAEMRNRYLCRLTTSSIGVFWHILLSFLFLFLLLPLHEDVATAHLPIAPFIFNTWHDVVRVTTSLSHGFAV